MAAPPRVLVAFFSKGGKVESANQAKGGVQPVCCITITMLLILCSRIEVLLRKAVFMYGSIEEFLCVPLPRIHVVPVERLYIIARRVLVAVVALIS